MVVECELEETDDELLDKTCVRSGVTEVEVTGSSEVPGHI